MSVLLSLWAIAGGFGRARGRTRAIASVVATVLVPFAVAAAMPTFAAALMVILGNAVGFAVSHVVNTADAISRNSQAKLKRANR
jgi:hypothetical protein